MKAAVVVFPGSNCDRDMATALSAAGAEVTMVWHKDQTLPAGCDLVALPGGFSYGDYLRCGAIAARAPIMGAVKAHVAKGGFAIGVCNGFQVLTEAGLLPGALLQNAGLRFVGRNEYLTVVTTDSVYTACYREGAEILIPVAHHEGNYIADAHTIAALQDQNRIAFRYVTTPNGATDDIAGILSENRRVLGMMPHPERAADAALGLTDGQAMFRGIIGGLVDS